MLISSDMDKTSLWSFAVPVLLSLPLPCALAAPLLPLAMTMGDPAGVGPLIAFKAYEQVRAQIVWTAALFAIPAS